MSRLDERCAEVFLKEQKRLFPEEVAITEDEAIEFLSDCMAEVFDSVDELKKFLQEEGVDISEYDDITEALEVFDLGDGRYMYVEA